MPLPQNADNKKNLQPNYLPNLLSTGAVKPGPITLISAEFEVDRSGNRSKLTFLERSEAALSLFREGRVSGSKVVVQVAEA